MLVTDELIEVQELREIIYHFRGIYGIYLKSMKENRQMTICNRWTWKHYAFA